MLLAEGHVMSDTAMVPRKSDGGPPGRRPLVDDELADQLMGKAAAEGWSCSARTVCCPKSPRPRWRALAE